MRADELAVRFQMEPHVEGGSFIELNDPVPEGMGRAPSGVIYYHLGSGEFSDFHVLDSDEYWLWHAGSTLELWLVDEDGGMCVRRLGIEDGAEPCILVKAGVIFGARHIAGAADGCFVSCVTSPRFSYEHYRILPKAEMIEKYPASEAFFAGLK
ncbi:MAG: cupin domain-containing protein [Clostridia bacterium]|nr:cupin domain-containing protein [Clostridia bacterium]